MPILGGRGLGVRAFAVSDEEPGRFWHDLTSSLSSQGLANRVSAHASESMRAMLRKAEVADERDSETSPLPRLEPADVLGARVGGTLLKSSVAERRGAQRPLQRALDLAVGQPVERTGERCFGVGCERTEREPIDRFGSRRRVRQREPNRRLEAPPDGRVEPGAPSPRPPSSRRLSRSGARWLGRAVRDDSKRPSTTVYRPLATESGDASAV